MSPNIATIAWSLRELAGINFTVSTTIPIVRVTFKLHKNNASGSSEWKVQEEVLL
jgi:hypothetical protein